MEIKGYASYTEIIEGVFRDLQLQDEMPWEDLIYWMYESMELIGVNATYIPKIIGHKNDPGLDIQNYKAELPCDFHKLAQISVNGAPARYTGNTFHHLLDGACCAFDLASQPTDVFIDNFGNTFSPQASVFLDQMVDPEITFDINNNYLTLSTQTGKVCIAYWAFPTDENGFPMIPDEIKYKKAVKAYLIYRISYYLWMQDRMTADKFQYNEREWLWYVGAAKNNANMPNYEQMESLKNQLVRLKPSFNEHSTFFRNLGKQERKRIH